jgi:hypothetical protein
MGGFHANDRTEVLHYIRHRIRDRGREIRHSHRKENLNLRRVTHPPLKGGCVTNIKKKEKKEKRRNPPLPTTQKRKSRLNLLLNG